MNKHKSNKIKENSNTVRHLNNGTDHRHSKSCCDQSSPARRTIKVLYNSHNQFYIFLLFVVPKKSILLKISGFHMFLQNTVFYCLSYIAQPGTR